MEGITLETIGYAILGGLIPSFLWLWFWLKEDKEKPEPKGLLALTFILGIVVVIIILPLEKLVSGIFVNNNNIAIVIWASLEEIIKYLAVVLIVFGSPHLDEPIDYPIYFITVALGFAALENALFLLKPLSLNDSVVSLLNGNLRFLGATLLHAIASGFIGIVLGISFYKKQYQKRFYLLGGLIGAIALHSVFNFFIMKDGGENFFIVFGFLWVITIINLLLFEKLRRMSGRI
ncbi:hypothetical protein A2995_01510 [Candidatus Nomurabacteria bacterium RIFCSPLOWO2_01_FULL_33_24]|uniref:Protease PrsW n=1 Tax=Candidatus Nomurabacteria bacterium RIFCSPLOWO2_01_FULL_33_24 TaxID=1801765 RepID=A0A1F6X2W2_9BACT|nr:MAG: hypothetical protein A2995_01510 [Candidatus Nomurabacteria bacterium RIFCSPLOWO2_01_FULL_33_24]